MDKKEEAGSKTKDAAEDKTAAQNEKAADTKDANDDNNKDGVVTEAFGEPDYSTIAPNGELDLYNVSNFRPFQVFASILINF